MIEIDVRKTFHAGGHARDFHYQMRFEEGKISAVTGPSGGGKTTLFRLISGLTDPDSGFISKGNDSWFDSSRGVNLSPQKRNIGYVFQDFALFPAMTVAENIRYAAKDEKSVKRVLELTGLERFSGRFPASLSGGEKQRVAFARAIVKNPDLLLLDEPLSAMDNDLRQNLQDEILSLNREFGTTVIFVSHHLPEIYRLAVFAAVLREGRFVRSGEPDVLFSNRVNSHKFSFTGEIVRLERSDILYVAWIAFGNSIGKVVLTGEDVAGLKVGDAVQVGSKAFNPIVKKIVPES